MKAVLLGQEVSYPIGTPFEPTLSLAFPGTTAHHYVAYWSSYSGCPLGISSSLTSQRAPALGTPGQKVRYYYHGHQVS